MAILPRKMVSRGHKESLRSSRLVLQPLLQLLHCFVQLLLGLLCALQLLHQLLRYGRLYPSRDRPVGRKVFSPHWFGGAEMTWFLQHLLVLQQQRQHRWLRLAQALYREGLGLVWCWLRMRVGSGLRGLWPRRVLCWLSAGFRVGLGRRVWI